MEEQWDIIIIGGGIAGYTSAKTILEKAPAHRVLLISGEDRIPYKRTKLSKYIAEGFEKDQFQLQSEDWYRQHHIELVIKKNVTSIDPQAHTITLESGERLKWRKLILATGAIPVFPENLGNYREGVYLVRQAEQVEGLIQAAKRPVRSVLVVGTGVLGIEVAEQLRLLQKQVTMVSINSTIMARHLNATISTMMQQCCEQEQIDLMFNEEVLALKQHADRSFEVTLREGTLTTDLVLFCIGVTPNTTLAKTAGLQVNCGIVVDQYLQTSHPDIFAAGDVAEHPGGKITFLWHAAEFQGMVAAENALGGTVPYEQPPFRLKCEVFGQYFLSIDKPPDSQLARYTVIEKTHNTIYQCFYYQEDLLHSVIMANDKARAKLYEKAVREKWNRKSVEEHFLNDLE